MDDTIEDLYASVGEVKDRILDTQSLGNMSINPPIEFEKTILKTTCKDVYMQNQPKLRIKSNVLVSGFFLLNLLAYVCFWMMHLLYIFSQKLQVDILFGPSFKRVVHIH